MTRLLLTCVLAVLTASTAFASGNPPWLRPPQGWVVLAPPASATSIHILAMWTAPAGAHEQLALALEPFPGTIAQYGATTRATLHRGPIKPSAYHDGAFACASGPAWLFEYDTQMFGRPQHFEQLAIKRQGDVYVGTYLRDITDSQNVEAAAALRGMCR